MKQFSIIYLLAIFYVSLASAQDGYDPVGKIKEVSVDILEGEGTSMTINGRNVYLYKVFDANTHMLQTYMAGNVSANRYTDRFPIVQCCTLVFENKIISRAPDQVVTITADEDVFKFYKKIHSLDKIAKTFRVTKVFYATNAYDRNVSIKAKPADFDAWLFIVVDGSDTSHILFTTDTIELPEKDESAKEVIFILRAQQPTPITVVFDSATNANKFHSFVQEIVDKNNAVSKLC